MKVFVQRVRSVVVHHDERKVTSIGEGLLLYVGMEKLEDEGNIYRMADTILNAKLFHEHSRSLMECNHEALLLSQFTLFAKFKKPKPDFHRAESHERARTLFHRTFDVFAERYNPEKVRHGPFGAYIQIEIKGDGSGVLVFDF